ncbi:hypothetical protein GCM10010341_28740 [Streptomyces noursei]|nr:hypothetical protein GCM10010341_28740 [Streptomyces noursei]
MSRSGADEAHRGGRPAIGLRRSLLRHRRIGYVPVSVVTDMDATRLSGVDGRRGTVEELPMSERNEVAV